MLNVNGIEASSIKKRDLTKKCSSSTQSIIHFHSEKLELEILHLQKIVDVVDARHLLERTGLGAHPSEVNSLLGLTRSKAISQILENINATEITVDPPEFIYSEHFPAYWIRWDYEETASISYF